MIHKEFMWQSKIFLKDFKDNLLEKFIWKPFKKLILYIFSFQFI
jgi:hypothetical protein